MWLGGRYCPYPCPMAAGAVATTNRAKTIKAIATARNTSRACPIQHLFFELRKNLSGISSLTSRIQSIIHPTVSIEAFCLHLVLPARQRLFRSYRRKPETCNRLYFKQLLKHLSGSTLPCGQVCLLSAAGRLTGSGYDSNI